jgi:hypothetical protein
MINNVLNKYSIILSLSLVVFQPLSAVEIKNFKIGGTIRANYILGDYEKKPNGVAQRGGDGGNFKLDVFGLKVLSKSERLNTHFEYRWYNGYNFFHTAALKFNLNKSKLNVGLTRVPFGVGAYGPANSWFFDQHFYVGLADDMDLGFHYQKDFDSLSLDIAYFPSSDWSGKGASGDSARYSYDIVNENNKNGLYEERHQFNFRLIKKLSSNNINFHPGFSLQYGKLDGVASLSNDTQATAVSVHSKVVISNWTVLLQASQFDYDASYTQNGKTLLSVDDDLIGMGAYDFAWPVASKGSVLAAAVSYTWKNPFSLADSVTFYNDYSVLQKDGDLNGVSLNDSQLNVTGFAIANKGWYIYVDHALSNGNFFVGNEGDNYATQSIGDFGANLNNKWNKRFNINLGYYF